MKLKLITRAGVGSPLREHPKLATRIAQSGHDVHVWTVNSEPDLRLCEELGVKAVITDRPAYLLTLLAR